MAHLGNPRHQQSCLAHREVPTTHVFVDNELNFVLLWIQRDISRGYPGDVAGLIAVEAVNDLPFAQRNVVKQPVHENALDELLKFTGIHSWKQLGEFMLFIAALAWRAERVLRVGHRGGMPLRLWMPDTGPGIGYRIARSISRRDSRRRRRDICVRCRRRCWLAFGRGARVGLLVRASAISFGHDVFSVIAMQ